MINQLRQVEDAQWSGDGRFDSMGHNAEYGVYTMFSNSISKLVHFELLQVIIYLRMSLSNNMLFSISRLSILNLLLELLQDLIK